MVIGIRKMSLIHDHGNLMLFEETDIYVTGVTFVVVTVFDFFFSFQARKYWDKFIKTVHYFNVFILEINVNYACESNKETKGR